MSALVADPASVTVLNRLGLAYETIGDLEAALKFYRLALSVDPRDLATRECEGLALTANGQAAKAEGTLNKIKHLCGDSCASYKNVAEALRAAKSAR